jgi:hypothetical protein
LPPAVTTITNRAESDLITDLELNFPAMTFAFKHIAPKPFNHDQLPSMLRFWLNLSQKTITVPSSANSLTDICDHANRVPPLCSQSSAKSVRHLTNSFSNFPISPPKELRAFRTNRTSIAARNDSFCQQQNLLDSHTVAITASATHAPEPACVRPIFRHTTLDTSAASRQSNNSCDWSDMLAGDCGDLFTPTSAVGRCGKRSRIALINA